MIKANELRIGNWVSFDSHYKQITDFEIFEYAVRNGKPISLTPEILEKAGFEWEEWQTHINKPSQKLLTKFPLLAIDTAEDHYSLYAFGYPLDPSSTCYLHQLQNLYFALTGKELEINNIQ